MVQYPPEALYGVECLRQFFTYFFLQPTLCQVLLSLPTHQHSCTLFLIITRTKHVKITWLRTNLGIFLAKTLKSVQKGAYIRKKLKTWKYAWHKKTKPLGRTKKDVKYSLRGLFPEGATALSLPPVASRGRRYRAKSIYNIMDMDWITCWT